jgi:cell wall-associated NlpC family hydrolase
VRFTPFVVLICAAIFTWAAVGAPRSGSSRPKGEGEEDATPRPKKSATPRPQPKAAETEDEDAKPKAKSSPVKKKSVADEEETKPVAKGTPSKRKAVSEDEEARPKSTPSKRKLAVDDEEDAKPKPKSTPSRTRPVKDEQPTVTPRANAPKTNIYEKSDEVKKKEAEATPVAPKPSATPGGKGAPPASVESAELAKYQEQPERVKQLIDAAIALSKQGLTYKYGSDDPANGGMDCSGSVAYLLRQQGFKDVPRDSSGLYTWARKNGQFFAVVSKKAGGFEFDDLQPGDLMFWSGTYSIDRDPPITHTMVFLGEHKRRKQPVMWGASDGRPYDGLARYGVGVFDFKMPKLGGEGEGTTAVGNHPVFLGYARIPGLREDARKR